jgi:hypothetical protein
MGEGSIDDASDTALTYIPEQCHLIVTEEHSASDLCVIASSPGVNMKAKLPRLVLRRDDNSVIHTRAAHADQIHSRPPVVLKQRNQHVQLQMAWSEVVARLRGQTSLPAHACVGIINHWNNHQLHRRLPFCMYHAPRTRVHKASLPCRRQQASLRFRTITSTYTPARKPKEEGSIASVFTSLSGSASPLPTRFSDLKKEIWRDVLMQSWREVLDELKDSIEKVVARGANVLQLAISSALARIDTLSSLDDTFRKVLGLAERTIDGSNLRNSGGRYHDRSGRRAK